MKDFSSELLDIFPYCLLVLLPVFIALSPVNPVEAAHEIQVHRLAHYELGGNPFGSKIASVALEARAITSSNLLRKIVVVKATSKISYVLYISIY